jgi:hypothetical protein
MKALAALLAALALAAVARGANAPVHGASAYLVGAQQADGGFAEPGGQSDPQLTAWAALGLVAGTAPADVRSRALAYLRAHEREASSDTEAALATLARLALGDRPEALLSRLRAVRPGLLVNVEIWTVLALRAAREPAPPQLVQALLRAQGAGGWSWTVSGAPDSNDTAAALQALRAAGIKGTRIDRGLQALGRFRNPDGGYGLGRGRPSDAQSTAWAIQALLAAGAKPERATWRYLTRLRRADGSYRYSARYGITPVWVTAQVVPALAGKPFPLVGE